MLACLLAYLLVTYCGQRALLYDPKGEAEHPDLAPEDVVRSRLSSCLASCLAIKPVPGPEPIAEAHPDRDALPCDPAPDQVRSLAEVPAKIDQLRGSKG